MFVLAYVGGSWLGRFVVAGVDLKAASQMTGFVLPTANETANEAAMAHRPERQFHDSGTANHVCTGCDAGETRYRQMAQKMGIPVAEDAEESGQQAEDGGTEAALDD